jgi:predicted PurR-regulated permease PerM
MSELGFQSERLRRVLVIVALTGLGILFYSTIHPFVISLVWAMILTVALWPIYRGLRKRLPGPATLPPLVMCVSILLLILVPLGLVGLLAAGEADALLSQVRGLITGDSGDLLTWLGRIPVVGDSLQEGLKSLREGATDKGAIAVILEQNKETLIGVATRALGDLVENAFKIAVCIFSAFFLFRHGEVLADQARLGALQLGGNRLAELLPKMRQTVRAVVYGLLMTALAQAVVAAFGCWVAGVGFPLLLGVLTFIFSFIPFGPPLVWIPAALSLFADDRPGRAIFLAIWGTLVISMMDNILRPIFIGQATHMPIFFVFVGVLGGLMSFGMVGLFVGPVTIALVLALWKDWIARREGKDAELPLWAAGS